MNKKISRKSALLNFGLPALLIGGYLAFSNMDRSQNPDQVSFDLPGITHHSLMGHGAEPDRVSTEKLLNKPMVLNFWASWCEACDKETHSLVDFWDRNEGKLNVVGVATRDDKKKILESGKMEFKHYPVAFDKEGQLAQQLRVSTLPQTLLIDTKGLVRHRIEGPATAEKLKELETSYAKLENLDPQTGEEKKFPISLSAISPPQKLPNFELTTNQGQSFKAEDLLEKVWLASFIFTTCDTMCPIISSEVRFLQDEFNGLNFVSISVDPETDTPEELRKYAKKYDADESRWQFLTGEWGPIRDILINGFKIGAPTEPAFHSDRLVLIDRKLRIRGYYSVNSKRNMKRMRKDIGYLLKSGIQH